MIVWSSPAASSPKTTSLLSKEMGVGEVFGPGTSTTDIIDYIKNHQAEASNQGLVIPPIFDLLPGPDAHV